MSIEAVEGFLYMSAVMKTDFVAADFQQGQAQWNKGQFFNGRPL